MSLSIRQQIASRWYHVVRIVKFERNRTQLATEIRTRLVTEAVINK